MRLTRKQAERIGNLGTGPAAPDGVEIQHIPGTQAHVLVFGYKGAEVNWIEVMEPEPTATLAWDLGR